MKKEDVPSRGTLFFFFRGGVLAARSPSPVESFNHGQA